MGSVKSAWRGAISARRQARTRGRFRVGGGL